MGQRVGSWCQHWRGVVESTLLAPEVDMENGSFWAQYHVPKGCVKEGQIT